jgi:hypothetical protein
MGIDRRRLFTRSIKKVSDKKMIAENTKSTTKNKRYLFFCISPYKVIKNNRYPIVRIKGEEK